MIYDIEHRTVYHFHRPVGLGPHRMTFRPRDSHDMRVLATALDVSPEPQRVDLIHDAYGNSLALIQPASPAQQLSVVARFSVEHLGSNAFALPAPHQALWMPPAYTAAERMALMPFLVPSYQDDDHAVRAWAQPFAMEGAHEGGPRHTIARMTEAIRSGFRYQLRHEEGVQTPQQTLQLGSGSCRDFATLMIDALRHVGVAARFVSGYLYSPPADPTVGSADAGSTHAWVQVYLPDCGWFPVDPTNNLIGGQELIRVAMAREAAEVVPLAGSWFGDTADFDRMEVQVSVTARSS